MLIGTAIIAGVSGYLIGIASSLGFLPIPFMPKAPRGRGVEFYDDEEESEAEDVDEGILDHAPNWANGLEADKRDGLRATAVSSTRAEKREREASTGDEECKMVLVVRTDLGMTKGTSIVLAIPPANTAEENGQGKLQRSAPTRRSIATRPASALTEPPCSGDGNVAARRKSRCKSKAWRSC
jgi:hypothetical protein